MKKDHHEKGPNNHLNRAVAHIRKACEAIHQFRAELPPAFREIATPCFARISGGSRCSKPEHTAHPWYGVGKKRER